VTFRGKENGHFLLLLLVEEARGELSKQIFSCSSEPYNKRPKRQAFKACLFVIKKILFYPTQKKKLSSLSVINPFIPLA